ncbi:hypothetical protein F7734_10065 [Scytonema sp. UIC 10036]|uniref:hypothetical protein n=1 Tax=Scytonema sp. UIC 10036 TaxID=2304196 RepID=UPI0012DA6016|nr:hypothetical protein [Scytonema sp. UIC 10036]MUG92776.1 hypothetical protein [Scytonema sp. UIC 10036]
MKNFLCAGIAIATISVFFIQPTQAQTRGQQYCRTIAGWNGVLERICNTSYVGTGDFIDNGLFFNRKPTKHILRIRVRQCSIIGYRKDGTPITKCRNRVK